VFLDAKFAVEDGLTMAGDFFPHSQPPVPGSFLVPNVSNSFPDSTGLVTIAIAPEFYMPTHAYLAIPTLAMVAHFDAQDLVNREYLSDQECTIWSSHKHFWQPPLVHKLFTCNPMDDKNVVISCCLRKRSLLPPLIMNLESTSNDDIFFEDELCVSFSMHLLPHDDNENNIIQDVSQDSTLQDVLHGFVSSSSQFVAGMSSALLSDYFNQKVSKLLCHHDYDLKHLDFLQSHLPVLYKVVGAHSKT